LAWALLAMSGVFEAVWATALGASNNFTRRKPTIVFVLALVVSLLMLAYAMNLLPVGTAYAVWVGIGAVLTVVLAVARRQEKLSLARAAMLVVLIGCVIGLKAVS
jgi:quaternary ammonium compound-resistance protein SugE